MAKQGETDVVVEILSEEEYNKSMTAISNSDQLSSYIPKRELSRSDVVHAFHDCFLSIGGVPRMAQWAEECPGDFFKLYARLLPSQASSALGEKNEFVIKHVLPKGALDE